MHLVGLDIGGSKTHAISRTPDGSQTEHFTGSANLSSVGEMEAGRQLDAIFASLDPRHRVDVVCAGAAGVDTPEAEDRLRDLIQHRAPGAAVQIVHDAHLILAAAGLDAGVAVISGTGSVAWSRDLDGATARAGGWGYLLGDEGSGYGIARDAVRHALRLADLGQPADRLAQQLAADCGLQRPSQLQDHFYATTERRYWAGRARVVFEAAVDGDSAAVRIVDVAAAALVDLVVTVSHGLAAPLPVVLGGGVLVHQPLFQTTVRNALAAFGIHDVRVLDHDPAVGALLLAEELAATLSQPRTAPQQRILL